MNNKCYAQKALRSTDIIYIDTSSLLKPKRLALFLKTYVQSDGLVYGKQIKIIKPVREELIKKIEMPETSALVNDAVAIVCKYKSSFLIEGDRIDDSLVEQTFADKDILSTLILNKPYFSQLIITNDEKLALDAFSLNNQQSVSGKHIYSCYIDETGSLKRSGNTIHATHSELERIALPAETIHIDSQEKSWAVNNNDGADNQNGWKWFAGGVASAVSILGLVKCANRYGWLQKTHSTVQKIIKAK